MVARLKSRYLYILLVIFLATFGFWGICHAIIYGYIPNSGDNTVSVINTGAGIVTNAPTLDSEPFGVTTSPSGDYIYVTNKTSNTVSRIDSQSLAIVSIGVSTDPIGIAISPDGAYAYVANNDGNLSVINTATNVVDDTVLVGTSLYGVAVHPSGEFI